MAETKLSLTAAFQTLSNAGSTTERTIQAEIAAEEAREAAAIARSAAEGDGSGGGGGNQYSNAAPPHAGRNRPLPMAPGNEGYEPALP